MGAGPDTVEIAAFQKLANEIVVVSLFFLMSLTAAFGLFKSTTATALAVALVIAGWGARASGDGTHRLSPSSLEPPRFNSVTSGREPHLALTRERSVRSRSAKYSKPRWSHPTSSR